MQEPVQANTTTLEILIASSQKHGAYDKTPTHQRGPEPCERTLFSRSQREREQRKAPQNTPTLHTFFPTVSSQPAMPPTLYRRTQAARTVYSYHGTRKKSFLQCPTSHGRQSCMPDLEGGCCSRTLMASQRGFQEQKGRLEEELQATGQLVIFYPEFHCEPNFIEKFWCVAKWYARKNCEYGSGGLKPTSVPASLAVVVCFQ